VVKSHDRIGPGFRVFEKAAPSRRLHRPGVKWLTWSKSFRQFVSTFRSELRAISKPTTVEVPGCEPYALTYHVPLSRLTWLRNSEMRYLARAMEATTPGPSLYVLDRLMDDEIDSDVLLSLFVMFRACFVHTSGEPSRAMCRPVNAVSRDPGFPLHADLFVHRRLMLVFDDVADRGGASLFLSVAVLTRLVRDNEECPPAVRRRIASLLQDRRSVDCFDELFDILHNQKHPWVPALERRMSDHQMVLPLRRGQGYLLDDSAWLHGRKASDIPVRMGRFRRLAF
jgi:hypothetical protein